MTIGFVLMILGVSLLIVAIAVALDVIPGYLRDVRLEKAVAESYRALELARQMESTIKLRVVVPVPDQPKKYVGKHRLAA